MYNLRFCFFGTYVKESYGIPSGNGGVLLKKILEKQNAQVIECHHTGKKLSGLIAAYFSLLKQHSKIQYDLMIIPWRGVLSLPLAKLIHRKPIIYFPAFSIYDTLVNDRKKIKENSLKAKFVHYVDKKACQWSDKIILESTEEINYFVKEFGIPKKKFAQLPLAADESLFKPQPEKKDEAKFIVLFFGSFIPLHGLETVVDAAKILSEDSKIEFKICGDGQTKDEVKGRIKDHGINNIELLGIVSKEDLLLHIKTSDVCLGIFGNTQKAQKVVTNKVFQILASQKPLITMESPASNEAHLVDKVNCLLVPPSNPEKLAEAILFLKDNPMISKQISKSGFETYKNHLSMDQVGKKMMGLSENLK
jgi:glycosyltransferase involved in cell wall biosynthesis